MQNLVKKPQSFRRKLAAAATSVVASGQALALDAASNTAITDAGSSGATSTGLAAAAVITVVVAMVGIGIAISILKRT